MDVFSFGEKGSDLDLYKLSRHWQFHILTVDPKEYIVTLYETQYTRNLAKQREPYGEKIFVCLSIPFILVQVVRSM